MTPSNPLSDPWPGERFSARLRLTLAARRGLTLGHCAEIFRFGPLTVFEPSASMMLLMKVNALRARGIDMADAQALWPLSRYETVEELLEDYYRAYPCEDPSSDPYFASWLRRSSV
jgi:hypothetical protein